MPLSSSSSSLSFTPRLATVLAALLWLLLAVPALHAAGRPSKVDAGETRRLHALFDEAWERSARDYPEWATYRGDNRFGDRLTDNSAAAIERRDAEARRTLARARSIRREALSPQDRLSHEVFVHGLAEEVRFQAFEGYNTMSLGSSGGFHTDFAELLADSPVATVAEAGQMLARLDAFPRRVDQEIARLRLGLAAGWVPGVPVLDRVVAQIDGQLPADVSASPFYLPFTKFGGDIAPADQARLRDAARLAIDQRAAPALRRLRAFVVDDYRPKAPPDGALGRYPGGAAVYEALVRARTTTGMSPRAIHELGLREVARLRAEMQAAMRETGFAGDLRAFAAFLNTDPKFFHPSGEALLAGYREIAKRIDPELPKLFAELPRMPYGVRAMPAHLGAGQADSYTGPALDGSRGGWFNANTTAYALRPTWAMETLVAHETVPGHHLQTARSVELASLPNFRRDGDYTAYSEGWALYAETLGPRLGLYADPYSRYGHLQSVVFRAARLVVDTGLHAFGWSRQQAIDYMVDSTGDDAEVIAAEIDRYYSWPAQALAYMVGQQKIVELRDRAASRLGERFDIRRFHQVVLDQGALPLDVLERVVDRWIAATAKAAAKAAPGPKPAPRRNQSP